MLYPHVTAALSNYIYIIIYIYMGFPLLYIRYIYIHGIIRGIYIYMDYKPRIPSGMHIQVFCMFFKHQINGS